MKETKEDKGYINKYHLIYPLIIMSVVIVLLTSFIFKESVYAGSMLSFAATLSSILLAVIAIIITLIDASGQRNNVYDVKSSVEELKVITEGFKELQNEYIVNNQKIREQMEVLQEAQKGTQETLTKVRESIVNIQFPESQDSDIKEQLEEIKETIDKQKEKGFIKYDSNFLDFTRPNYSYQSNSDINKMVRSIIDSTKKIDVD